MPAITYTETDVAPGTKTRIQNVILAATVATGQATYKAASDGQGRLVDSGSDAAPADGEVFGVAIAGGAAGQLGTFLWADGDSVDFGAGTLTAGEWYVAGASGAIKPAGELAAGEYSILIGYAETDSRLVLRGVRTGVQH